MSELVSAMNRLLAADLISEYTCDGDTVAYKLTQKGRELRRTLRATGTEDGLSQGDVASIAYSLFLGEDDEGPVCALVLNRVELGGRTFRTPSIPVSGGVWRGVCPQCRRERCSVYFLEGDRVFFCVNCGYRGRYTGRGTVTMRAREVSP